jgi:hypothetical protein
MNNSLKIASVLVLAVASGSALAQDPGAPKTREQVRAELLEAQQRGEVMADGESGRMLNELSPRQYPARATASSKTRAEVQAELLEARRNGEVFAGGDSDSAFTQRYPGGAMAAAPGRTRAEVKAELLEAQRRGETMMNGDSDLGINGVYPYRARSRARSE